MNRDRLGLFCLAGMALVGLIGIAWFAMHGETKDAAAIGLVGTVAGLLGSSINTIIIVIRAAWTDERTGALTDHLASATPVGEPQKVEVTNTTDKPIPTEEAK